MNGKKLKKPFTPESCSLIGIARVVEMRLLLAQLGSARNATFRLSRAIAADAFYVLLINNQLELSPFNSASPPCVQCKPQSLLTLQNKQKC